ncbi:MAG: DeoR/GlpR transcriptional regulator [Clostridia bacterium]|nr:DeoR/GlpR transcriptional regulator [Clostridia bacterium]
MLKNEREREILNLLKERDGFVSVHELCETLFASESSIRRDLAVLEKRGIVKRNYGGAELITSYSNVVDFSHRTHYRVAEKRAIAKKAASLIKDGSIVFLDQTSTTFYLAEEIKNNHTLTVVTNSIEILGIMSGTGVKTVSSGGILCADNRVCLVGADAHATFEKIYADMAFFSAKSLSGDGVISDCSLEEVQVRRAMMGNARKRIFLCDSEKFNTQSGYKLCTLSDIDYLVSENDKGVEFSGANPSLIIL